MTLSQTDDDSSTIQVSPKAPDFGKKDSFILDDGLEQEDFSVEEHHEEHHEGYPNQSNKPANNEKKRASHLSHPRQRQGDATEKSVEDSDIKDGKECTDIDDALPTLQQQVCSVIIQNFPAHCTKQDLDKVLQGIGSVVDLKVRKLPDSSFVVKVVFDDSVSRDMALLLHDTQLPSGEKLDVIAGHQNWDAYVVKREKNCKGKGGLDVAWMTERFSGKSVGQAFWGSFSAMSRSVKDLESKLHLQEKLQQLEQDSKRLCKGVEESLSLGEKTEWASKAGKDNIEKVVKNASKWNEENGFSSKVSDAMKGAATNSKHIAHEIDETLHVSDKVRDMANWALNNNNVSSGVKGVQSYWTDFMDARNTNNLSPVATPPARRRTKFVPSGTPQESPLDRKFLEANLQLTSQLHLDEGGN